MVQKRNRLAVCHIVFCSFGKNFSWGTFLLFSSTKIGRGKQERTGGSGRCAGSSGWPETVSDITYGRTNQGWLCLTIGLDLFERKITGWSMSGNIDAGSTVVTAFKMAIRNRPVNPEAPILQSDRESTVCLREIPKTAAILPHPSKHETQRELRGQRRGGKLH